MSRPFKVSANITKEKFETSNYILKKMIELLSKSEHFKKDLGITDLDVLVV